jgi:hypothetical protein
MMEASLQEALDLEFAFADARGFALRALIQGVNPATGVTY